MTALMPASASMSTPRFDHIRALVLDCDGVLTDGTIVILEDGTVARRLSFRDVMGLSRARQHGLHLALISGEKDDSVLALAERCGISTVLLHVRDKLSALHSVAAGAGIHLDEVCYIGDDLNDMECIAAVGVGVAVADAAPATVQAADHVTSSRGGHGAVREIIDRIILEASVPQ